MAGLGFKLAHGAGRIDRAAPRLGQHTDEILVGGRIQRRRDRAAACCESRLAMEIAATTLDRAAAYKLMTGAIVPRPVAWVTTRSVDGVVNAAPYSAYTLISPDPPLVVFHSSRRNGDKDSARNIRATGEFVVNVAKRICSCKCTTARRCCRPR